MKHTIIILVVVLCSYVYAQIDPTDKVYFGLLHAHTMLSDGSGTPKEAYQMAKSNGLDFFAITPHNHSKAEQGAGDRADGILIATQHDLYNGTGNITVTKNNGATITIKSLIKTAEDMTNNNFLAIYGQEFSTISQGNHINVLGIDDVIEVENGNFRGLVDLLNEIKQSGKPVPVLQLNHPNVQQDLFYNGMNENVKKHMFNDYGIDEGDLGPDFSNFVKELDPFADLTEVLSGPAKKKERIEKYHYNSDENDYYFYLKEGLHLSPTAGQDNHYATWGRVTDARTGVVAKELTKNAIYDAFRNHRTFATEDKNLKIVFYANDSIMGKHITAEVESELNLKVFIKDADEPDAEYDISIYWGEINPELSTKATNWKASDGLIETITEQGDGTYNIPNVFVKDKPEFFYAKITQEDNDRAWTAPVWVNDQITAAVSTTNEPQFFWTKSSSSHVYHIKGCPSIAQIKPSNLMSGNTPPSGRTQHHCKVPTEETH